MPRMRRIALVVALLVACVGCDQTTKSLARDQLQGHQASSFFNDTFRLEYAENPGAFLSLGASLPHYLRTAIFTIGGAVMIGAVLLYAALASKAKMLQIVALSLICGGGIGNLADRVRYDGFVTDFLNMGIGSIRTGIFNMADVALMTGIVLLLLYRQSGQSLNPLSGSHPP
jgi:signal peptidase II